MQSRQTEVDDLSEVFIDGVDSFASSCSDSVPQRINDAVQLFRRVLSSLGLLQQPLDFLHHLMAAGRETTHLGKN